MCTFILLVYLQEAHLSQRDRETRCVSWKLVNCCTTVRKSHFRPASEYEISDFILRSRPKMRFSYSYAFSRIILLCDLIPILFHLTSQRMYISRYFYSGQHCQRLSPLVSSIL